MSCAIEDCTAKVVARGWCRKHYMRWKRHGSPLVSLHGTGTLTAKGYIRVRRNGGPPVYLHRIKTQAKPGQVVHHRDNNKANNTPNNLEIFESQSDHMLAHFARKYGLDETKFMRSQKGTLKQED